MMKQQSTTIIPLFPLNITVLPDESIALHVFEPQFRQLTNDCIGGKEFGIIYFNDHYRSNYGTTVHIEQVVNIYPDGTSDIIIQGDHIFELKEFFDSYENKMYSSAEIELKSIKTTSTEELSILFRKYLQQSGKIIHNEEGMSIFSIANRLELSNETKNKLIALSSHEAMIKFLLNETRFLLKIKQQESQLEKNFYLN